MANDFMPIGRKICLEDGWKISEDFEMHLQPQVHLDALGVPSPPEFVWKGPI